MTKSKNRSWIQRHVKDPYVKQSQVDGFRSRASYKLLEIVEKDRLIRSGMTVVDLGSSPGGWSQVASSLVRASGSVVALDILPMDPVSGVEFIQGDFTEDVTWGRLQQLVKNRSVDLVISDMAPNISGSQEIDQPAMIHLAEMSLDLALKSLDARGVFISKLFHGQGFDRFVLEVRKLFNKVSIVKPKASRPKSKEVYIVASGPKLTKEDK
ncbi:MAG: RlmE family RNA methyltransferase [Porticoccaceae bacterium]|nr:RlmE family RNA methyltransferase [Porticoccaceae bacterium]